MAKITLATIKKFIRENANDLYVRIDSRFDGMIDCVDSIKNPEYVKVDKDMINFEKSNTLGIPGAWFVGSSRDRFYSFADDNFTGYQILNCCGGFILATKKA